MRAAASRRCLARRREARFRYGAPPLRVAERQPRSVRPNISKYKNLIDVVCRQVRQRREQVFNVLVDVGKNSDAHRASSLLVPLFACK